MFIRTKIAVASLAAILTILGGTTSAQETQPNNNATPPRQRDPQIRRMKRRDMRGGLAHGLRQLNLTDQQQQQMRSVAQTQVQGTQAQRQELGQLMQKRRTGTLTPQDEARAKELRQQLMQSRQGVRTQMLALLTPEQKNQLEQMKKTRRENRGKFHPGKQKTI